MNTTARGTPSGTAALLGCGGLIPFVGLALASWFVPAPYRSDVLHALATYAATIASFVGALHWGAAMHRDDVDPARLLAWGVVPSLVAWLALLANAASALLILAALLMLCFGVDRVVYPRLGLAEWLPMRLRLTAVAVISCMAAALASVAF
jgi:hypothetical protein